ncbi:lycopene cyclase family protein [Roseovarius sp. D22-M7]|uniref:lycopene cyclase family protein n=1 Tax=Roseovarius sp. D22-M7 TaxID=3127116 RepID=UPI00300FB46A
MPRPDVDIAILGGGCAGLSVAVRLALAGRSLLVIEPRAQYVDDRAWSFWRTAPDPFEDCVRASWSRWEVGGPGGAVCRGSAHMRYQTVAAGAVYDRAQSLIADSPLAALSMGTSANDLHKSPDGWRIETDTGTLHANHVIDTRPPRRIPTYGQFFLGREIRTERPVFDPGSVQLMQFRPARSRGVDFVYILPFARDCALVEVTSFAPTSPGRAVFEDWLETEIAGLQPGRFEVLREETGALPMEVGFAEPPQPGVIRMGLGGGAARPSTGYAFTRIQSQADHVAEALRRGAMPRTLRDGLATRFMDRVFLQVLQTMPERGPALFEGLFRNAAPDRLERFLSGSTHPADRLSVMTSLPTLPFLRAALVPA